MRAAPHDQFYLSTCYPSSLPGGIPADAFVDPDAYRAGSRRRSAGRCNRLLVRVRPGWV